MKIDGRADPDSLSALGAEAVRRLCSNDIDGLATRFGYALAFDRMPAVAITEDLKSCLAEVGATSVMPALKRTPTVSYFEPNDTGLFAVIECVVLTDSGAELLVELIATVKQGDKHVTLEQISAVL